MIQMHRDYLLFETPKGELIPCSAELAAVELVGEAATSLDPELIQQAARAVLHYFREDLGRTTVSVAEFTKALEHALRTLGLSVLSEPHESGPVCSCDLRQLAAGADRAFELSFFTLLRDEMRARLGDAPQVLRFHGLRGCVKQLVGAKRWSQRCQVLNDQIVDYLRACLATESAAGSCGLVIR